MTERKFTVPNEFPATKVDQNGDEWTLICRLDDGWLVGVCGFSAKQFNSSTGRSVIGDPTLYDLPVKRVHWANDYGNWLGPWCDTREGCGAVTVDKFAVIRREWVEGEKPQYFTEAVE